MELKDYINELKRTRDGIPSLIDEYVEKESRYMVGFVKRRFWDYGIDGNGELIGGGVYAESTIARKKKTQYSRTSHITLRDTKQWQDSLFASYHNGELLLDSSDKSLTAKLVDGEGNHFQGYGEAIMDFTREELDMYEDKVLGGLRRYLEEKFNKDINEEI